MAKQALIFHHNQCLNLTIEEAICFDGLENFAGSQYDVNNIQQAIGRDSLFIYDFNFACLNRKGRMSKWQKNRLCEIEAMEGRYNPQAIRIATHTLIRRLYEKRVRNKPFTLLSDEHFQYRHAIQRDLNKIEIDHVTISSKACRNFQNILFPVNHADLMIRQQLGAFSRETISFSKSAGAMCQKYVLYLVYKNYMSPQFTKKHVRRPFAHSKSPAELLGICKKMFTFSDVFSRRSVVNDLKTMNSEWKCFWNGNVPSQYKRDRRFVKLSSHKLIEINIQVANDKRLKVVAIRNLMKALVAVEFFKTQA